MGCKKKKKEILLVNNKLLLLLSDSGTPQLYSLADVHMDILCYALFCFGSTAIQETGGCPHIASTPFDDDKTFDSWTSFW